MSVTIRSSWLDDSGQSREDTRLTQLGATVPVDATRVLSGILPGSPDHTSKVAGFWLTDQSGMTATVQPGRAVIQGLATQGAYPVTLAEATTVTLDDGDPANTRIDLICLSVHDSSYDSSEETVATLDVIKGDPTLSTPPAVPNLALPLYYVTVPRGASAGGTAIAWTGGGVQDLRTTTVAIGGVLPVYGNAAVPGAYTSQLRDYNNVLQRWDGTQWVSYPAAIGGIAPAGTATGGYNGQYRDGTGGYLQRWSGSAWKSAVPGPAFNFTADAGDTSSTTYTATLGDVPAGSKFTLAFAAPPSGAVLVTLGSAMHCTGNATTTLFMSVSIAPTAGGSAVFSPSDDAAASGTGSYQNSVAGTFRVSGLTPGTSYTATTMYRNSDSKVDGWFDNRFIRVDPVL
jgi:hypothetical protein